MFVFKKIVVNAINDKELLKLNKDAYRFLDKQIVKIEGEILKIICSEETSERSI